MKFISVFLVFSFLLLDFTVQQAKAEMIDTRAIVTMTKQDNDRGRVMAFLDRQDVQQTMTRQGVAPEEAKKRVAALSDDEVSRIAGAMDQLPAGGNALGTLVGAALLVFVILLITDITGLTHVFSFVNHRR
jgi:hypothetical protein